MRFVPVLTAALLSSTAMFIAPACQWRRQIVPDGGLKVYQSG